jgi:hypothetical protein
VAPNSSPPSIDTGWPWSLPTTGNTTCRFDAACLASGLGGPRRRPPRSCGLSTTTIRSNGQIATACSSTLVASSTTTPADLLYDVSPGPFSKIVDPNSDAVYEVNLAINTLSSTDFGRGLALRSGEQIRPRHADLESPGRYIGPGLGDDVPQPCPQHSLFGSTKPTSKRHKHPTEYSHCEWDSQLPTDALRRMAIGG